MTGTGNLNFALSPLNLGDEEMGVITSAASLLNSSVAGLEAAKCLAEGEEGADVDVLLFPG